MTTGAVEYVVCDRLLDPETNEHCEFDGDVPVDADGYWACPGCRARRRVANAWTDPEPWLDPITAGDTREVRWATVDRVGRMFYEYAPRTRAEYDHEQARLDSLPGEEQK
jgi:hypothetical protein